MLQILYLTPIYINNVRPRDENNMNMLINIIPVARNKVKVPHRRSSCTRNNYYLHHMFTTPTLIVQTTGTMRPNTTNLLNIEMIDIHLDTSSPSIQ